NLLSNTLSTNNCISESTKPMLRKKYYTSCYYDDHYFLQAHTKNPLAGQFVVVAPYAGTTVTIHNVACDTRASDDGMTVAHKQGETWSVTLDQGQTYLVQSTGLNYGTDDLTGTLVTSDQPIGMLSGHQRASIPIGGLDGGGA